MTQSNVSYYWKKYTENKTLSLSKTWMQKFSLILKKFLHIYYKVEIKSYLRSERWNGTFFLKKLCSYKMEPGFEPKIEPEWLQKNSWDSKVWK